MPSGSDKYLSLRTPKDRRRVLLNITGKGPDGSGTDNPSALVQMHALNLRGEHAHSEGTIENGGHMESGLESEGPAPLDASPDKTSDSPSSKRKSRKIKKKATRRVTRSNSGGIERRPTLQQRSRRLSDPEGALSPRLIASANAATDAAASVEETSTTGAISSESTEEKKSLTAAVKEEQQSAQRTEVWYAFVSFLIIFIIHRDLTSS